MKNLLLKIVLQKVSIKVLHLNEKVRELGVIVGELRLSSDRPVNKSKHKLLTESFYKFVMSRES